MKRWPCLALALTAACGSRFDGEQLGVKFEPPRGFTLAEQVAGPPARARFEPGLELLRVDGAPPKIDPDALPGLLQEITRRCALSLPGELRSARAGTLATGEVARFELKAPSSRTLLYYIPGKDRFLVVTLTAPESRYGEREIHLERALGSLRYTP